MDESALSGKVALVTGASKNIGKGIALEVARAGAVTYVTARSLEDEPGELASLRRTVDEMEQLGARGVPVVCDHTVDEQVEAVFDRIRQEHGRLDLVVNVASPDFSDMVGVPFWELPFESMSRCLDVGPRSNFVTTALAARMMIPQRSGLVVNVSSHGAVGYLLSVPYGVGKAAIDKVTRDTALELREHGVVVVSLWPGLVLTEGLMANTELQPDGRRLLHGLDIKFGETPKLNGMAVVALATDDAIGAKAGGSYRTGGLAREYGFTEDDGGLPPEDYSVAARHGEVPEFWKGVERFADQPT